MDKVNDDSRASNFTTNEESNVWDDWEPDLDSIQLSVLENSGSIEQSTLHNRSFINAVEEPCNARKAIGIYSPIPIFANHSAQINISNVPVKLSNKERLAAVIDGREVKWFELDISGHERVLIALHKDLKKLLSYINAQSEHQFAESDIMVTNGIFLGLLEKRSNIIPAMERTSKKCHGKVSVCVTMPYQNTFSPVIPNNLQAVTFKSASALPSTSSSNATNKNLYSAVTQPAVGSSLQNGNVTNPPTTTCVLRLYSVSKDVEFFQFFHFCSQFGPVIHIQTEVSHKEKKKTVFVELAVKPTVAETFVREWTNKCRINNTNFVMMMSHYPTIHKKTPEAKADMIAYKASKMSEN